MKRDKLVEVTSKLPFAGRHFVRRHYLEGREAAQEGNVAGKLGSMAVLGMWGLVHACQAKMGIDAGLHHAHQSGALAEAETGYDSLYILANCAVTYAQARLVGKLAFMGRTRPERVPAMLQTEPAIPDAPYNWSFEHSPEPAHDETPSFTSKNRPVDLVVTVAGQALFLATWL